MKISDIVFKELRERKSRLLTNFLVIFLSTMIIISLQIITSSSKKALTKLIRNLGPNMFILPRLFSLNNFYTANYNTKAEMPESYLYRLASSGLLKKEAIKAQLSSRIKFGNHHAIISGIKKGSDPERQNLKKNGILLGSEIARLLKKKNGEQLIIADKKFIISNILPEKGTVDDIKIYLPLHIVQDLLSKGKVINTIEIIHDRTVEEQDLVKQIEILLPGTRVITKKGIAKTQSNTIQALRKYSLLLLTVILIIGGINIANYIFINVRARRKDIGILLAVGATPKIILKIFLQKAILLGLTGGLAGYLFGTVLAVTIGAQIIKVPVTLDLKWSIAAIIFAVIFSMVSSAVPAIRAANLDPVKILKSE